MKQYNVIPLEKKSIFLPKKKRKVTKSESAFSISASQKVNAEIIEISAQAFSDSILLGNLYRELMPKNKMSKSKITRM